MTTTTQCGSTVKAGRAVWRCCLEAGHDDAHAIETATGSVAIWER